jgi:hypothetical protein
LADVLLSLFQAFLRNRFFFLLLLRWLQADQPSSGRWVIQHPFATSWRWRSFRDGKPADSGDERFINDITLCFQVLDQQACCTHHGWLIR